MAVEGFTSDSGMLVKAKLAEFVEARSVIARELLASDIIHPTKWQQLDVSGSPMHQTHEIQNLDIWFEDVPADNPWVGDIVPADQPWAEDHFQERVGGQPVNPGGTHHYWPYHGASLQLHLRDNGKLYDHNYMERFWPKHAGSGWRQGAELNQQTGVLEDIALGYRFPIGDLQDVVQQLIKEPTTRQAYLPVWFPEDTGALYSQRVPCTLGYHFLYRNGKLSMNYYLRSCEVYRHFTNDVYLAARLLQWVAWHARMDTGDLHLHIASFHGFVGDVDKIKGFIQ